MSFRYTGARSLAWLAQGRCPECGGLPSDHGGWGHGSCLLTDNGVAQRLAAYQQDVEPAPPQPAPAREVWGGGCECWLTPEHQKHYYGSAVEPGSDVEWNPDCPKHRPTDGSDARA